MTALGALPGPDSGWEPESGEARTITESDLLLEQAESLKSVFRDAALQDNLAGRITQVAYPLAVLCVMIVENQRRLEKTLEAPQPIAIPENGNDEDAVRARFLNRMDLYP